MASSIIYIEDENKGLPSTFKLDNGGFALSGGESKAEDSLFMVMHFLTWFRLFVPEFIPDIMFLYQKNTTFVRRFKNIFRLRFFRAVSTYCPYVELGAVNMPIDLDNRTSLLIDIDYKYRLNKIERFKPVRFEIAL